MISGHALLRSSSESGFMTSIIRPYSNPQPSPAKIGRTQGLFVQKYRTCRRPHTAVLTRSQHLTISVKLTRTLFWLYPILIFQLTLPPYNEASRMIIIDENYDNPPGALLMRTTLIPDSSLLCLNSKFLHWYSRPSC